MKYLSYLVYMIFCDQNAGELSLYVLQLNLLVVLNMESKGVVYSTSQKNYLNPKRLLKMNTSNIPMGIALRAFDLLLEGSPNLILMIPSYSGICLWKDCLFFF
jgi:hypothetical protein